MRTRVLGLIAFVVVLSPLGTPALRADSREDVENYLKNEFKAFGYTINAITEDYVGRTFPGIDFFEVIFRQYPVGVAPPEGLSSSNLFATFDGQVFYLTSVDELNGAYTSGGLNPVTTAEQVSDTASTWARFAAALHQDLFYTFAPVETYVEATGSGGWIAATVMSVSAGGTGYVSAFLEFNADGVLVVLFDNNTVQEGMRPICQATKLLDPDPLVRRMAEQQVLSMGRRARPYLDEQRARATPELQTAIDRIWQRILVSNR